jgi:hypothetical protein
MSPKVFLKMAVAAVLLCASEARAEGPSWKWSRVDVGMQTTFLAITAFDWSQTIDFTQDPNSKILETNLVLGPEPSRARVNAYMPLAMLGHTAVAAALPHGKLRTLWQTTWIAVETKMVVSNYRLGIGLSLPW